MDSTCCEGLSLTFQMDMEKLVLFSPFRLVTFSFESLNFTKIPVIKPSLRQGYVGLGKQQ